MGQQMICFHVLDHMDKNGIQLQIIQALSDLMFIMQKLQICIKLKIEDYKILNINYHLIHKEATQIWNGEMVKDMYILLKFDFFYSLIIKGI